MTGSACLASRPRCRGRSRRPCRWSWRRRWRASLLVLAVGSLCCASGGRAAPIIDDARIGFDGHYKVGRWTPVTVKVRGLRPDHRVVVAAPDGDGVPMRVFESALAPASSNADVSAASESDADQRETTVRTLVTRVGAQTGEAVVTVESEGVAVARRSFALGVDWPAGRAAGQTIDLLVGFPPGRARDPEPSAGGAPSLEVRRSSPLDLPRQWLGYDCVDAVLIAASQPVFHERQAELVAQIDALDAWVRRGGRLVFSCGRQCEAVLRGESPWARFAPGRLTGVGALAKVSAIETYAKTNEPLNVDEFYRLPIAQLADVRGVVEASEGAGRESLPLVVRSPYGFGEIVFVAYDLDDPEIVKWKSNRKLLDRLLARGGESWLSTPQSANFGAVNTLGYTDLSGQLRAAIEQFSQVEFVSFALVASLIGLYILCIGPLDYWLVKRLLRRMELTWITFPLWAAIFSAGALWFSQRTKGEAIRLNQIDLVDVDVESRSFRGLTWLNLFSPATRAYDFAIRPDPALGGSQGVATHLTWLGLPGTGFGGMHQVRTPTPVFSQAYHASADRARLEGVPIAVWSTKGLSARWWREGEPPVVGQLEDRGAQSLLGRIESRLSVSLSDVLLVYERWVYPLPALAPGGVLTLDRHLSPLPLDGVLRQNDSRRPSEKLAAYDLASGSVPNILEKMMFFDAVGGRGYVRLSNDDQSQVDFSHLLRDGRAILAARSSAAAVTLECDGAPLAADAERQWTFYRFVFPVRRRADSHD